MRRIQGILAILVTVVWATAAFAAEGMVDYPVASVNSQKITRSQVEARQETLSQMDTFKSTGGATFNVALEAEIERVLLMQAANQYIDKDTRDRIRKYSEENSKKMLDPRVYDPEREGKKALDQYGDRVLLDVYLERKLYNHISVSPAQIRAFYDRNRDLYTKFVTFTMRQVLVRFEGRSEDEARALVEKAAARIRAGEDFAKVATEMSQDPYAAQGGLWPAQKRGDAIPEVERAALNLNPGGVSQPFSTPLGWHIVKLESVEGSSITPFEQAQDEISRKLMEQAQTEARTSLLTELRSKAIVQLYPVPAQVTLPTEQATKVVDGAAAQ
jgi:parvulin-like peptidyl-prolyl isomerase